ncbi:NAD(P)-binding domain-containing protein [Microvirga yunnanensis]|uniref:NAD(P)-binding domain-containing protein n=1 Tax=Microvirga yunnanensis TaxID=2953740 RepID=UPI0021C87855|nr:NAD(P)-binding domain-containing protein [Microvirga sp. HBU65207]
MQLRTIGLGRIGADIAGHLRNGSHECVVYDRLWAAVQMLVEERAVGAVSLEEHARPLTKPRLTWMTVTAGAADESISTLWPHPKQGKILIDSGKSYHTDDGRWTAAMEPPIPFDADTVRAKKAEIIKAIRPIGEAEASRNAVRRQCGADSVANNPAAYRHEPGGAPDSITETFVGCKLNVYSWRCVRLSSHRRIQEAAENENRDLVLASPLLLVSRHRCRANVF